jgi:hypothetical protein
MEDETQAVEGQDAAPVEEQEVTETPIALAPDNRPPQNVLGEVNRKYTKIERQMLELQQQNAEMMNLLRTQQQRPQAAPVQQTGAEYSDDQLATLQSQGNAEAARILSQRFAEREAEKKFSAWQQTQAVQNGVAQLMGKYPQLHDNQDPLTQAVYQARQTFLSSGWTPGAATDLEAIKAAILNAPHLVKQPSAARPDMPRQSAVTAQQSMDGSAPRRSPQQGRAQGPALTPRQAELAKRYGVKDPQGAIKRFADRRQAGTSVLNPNLESTVREQENA